MSSLPTTPAKPSRTGGTAVGALTAGPLRWDPVPGAPRRGRVRRWAYAAGGGADVAVGAAVVDIGLAGQAFVWATVAGHMTTWQRTVAVARGLAVAHTPQGTSRFDRGTEHVRIDGDGGLLIDVTVDGARLQARLAAGAAVVPAVLRTATPDDGWNCTQKAAGYPVQGQLRFGAATHAVAGGGWRDWTAGRQDRRTSWRWAAAAGTAQGRDVGLNVSTGMNGRGPGEDIVWWDGVPCPLPVRTLAFEREDATSRWTVAGPGWQLGFVPAAVRAADERRPFVRSRYVQPVGTFHGTLPDPRGHPVEVTLFGVTEDHDATW